MQVRMPGQFARQASSQATLQPLRMPGRRGCALLESNEEGAALCRQIAPPHQVCAERHGHSCNARQVLQPRRGSVECQPTQSRERHGSLRLAFRTPARVACYRQGPGLGPQACSCAQPSALEIKLCVYHGPPLQSVLLAAAEAGAAELRKQARPGTGIASVLAAAPTSSWTSTMRAGCKLQERAPAGRCAAGGASRFRRSRRACAQKSLVNRDLRSSRTCTHPNPEPPLPIAQRAGDSGSATPVWPGSQARDPSLLRSRELRTLELCSFQGAFSVVAGSRVRVCASSRARRTHPVCGNRFVGALSMAGGMSATMSLLSAFTEQTMNESEARPGARPPEPAGARMMHSNLSGAAQGCAGLQAHLCPCGGGLCVPRSLRTMLRAGTHRVCRYVCTGSCALRACELRRPRGTSHRRGGCCAQNGLPCRPGRQCTAHQRCAHDPLLRQVVLRVKRGHAGALQHVRTAVAACKNLSAPRSRHRHGRCS